MLSAWLGAGPTGHAMIIHPSLSISSEPSLQPTSGAASVGRSEMLLAPLAAERQSVSQTESSLPVLPVARSSACVRNRDDVDVLVPHTIAQPIGKSSEEPRASSASGCPDIWAGADQFDCVGYSVEGLTAEAMRFCSYQRTASANSAEAGWLIRKGFTARECLSRCGA